MSGNETRTRSAGLFDLRWIIAVLIGLFGVVVTLMGVFDHGSSTAASGQPVGVNVNLWTGVPMILLAAGFGIWAAVRPLRLPIVSADLDEDRDGQDEA
ncbi:MAG: hypothetical protein J2P24_14405 [Streptosporangiales bacterium]|nr:hypothetical protein [Streptosporangiales bacterium]